jgi:hypothetical protein
MREISPLVWFGKREVTHIPKHFVKAPTPVLEDSYEWVQCKLTGRFGIGNGLDTDNDLMVVTSLTQYIYFEDPADAMMFELRWSGSK